MIKKLFTLKYKDGKITEYQDDYSISNNEYGISVMKSCGGWCNISQSMYDRIYGDNPKAVAINRKNWLENDILPQREQALADAKDEISALDKYISTQ